MEDKLCIECKNKPKVLYHQFCEECINDFYMPPENKTENKEIN